MVVVLQLLLDGDQLALVEELVLGEACLAVGVERVQLFLAFAGRMGLTIIFHFFINQHMGASAYTRQPRIYKCKWPSEGAHPQKKAYADGHQITRFCSYNYFYWIGPPSPSPEPSRKRVLSSFLPICCTHTCQCGMCFGNLMERACRC